MPNKNTLKKLSVHFILWLCWVFTAAHGLSLVALIKGYSSLWFICF